MIKYLLEESYFELTNHKGGIKDKEYLTGYKYEP